MTTHHHERLFKAALEQLRDRTHTVGETPRSPHKFTEHECVEQMVRFATGQIEAQTKIYDALVVKYQNLLKWYDEHEGTPCEQIRHQHEIEEAVRPLYEALKHSGHAPSCNRLFWVGGHGVCDCGRDATLIVACEKWPGLEEK